MGLSSADRDADFTAETVVVAVVGAVVFVGVAVVVVAFGFSVTSICLVAVVGAVVFTVVGAVVAFAVTVIVLDSVAVLEPFFAISSTS